MTSNHFLCKDEVLYFLHIPKTAGVSFTTCLNEQYPEDEICPVHLWHHLLAIPAEQRERYRVFRGHFYSYLNRVIDRPLQTITFLRDPVERALSHYGHIHRAPYHYFYELLHQQGSVLAFLNDSRTSPLIANFQTRALALDVDPVAIASTLSQAEINDLILEQTLETILSTTLSDEELLQRAKVKLEQCLFVGITERFSESVAALTHILRWENPTEAFFLNNAPTRLQRDELDSETLDALNEKNRLDHELYAYGCNLLEKSLALLS